MTKLKLELSQYYQEAQWPMIRHPLVYAVPFFDTDEEARRLNALLVQKQKAVSEAMGNNKWSEYIFLHERPWRVHAFLEIQDNMNDKQYWPLLREIWIDSENIYPNRIDWWELLTSTRLKENLFMNAAERSAFSKLPEEIEVYRGTTEEEKESSYLGFSWTLDKGRAAWFATRFQRQGGPVLATAIVSKEDCVGLLLSRNEDEIVIPHRRTNGIVWEEL
jgi:hypothetical protein